MYKRLKNRQHRLIKTSSLNFQAQNDVTEVVSGVQLCPDSAFLDTDSTTPCNTPRRFSRIKAAE
jgi:hypothetical protein